MRSGSKRHRIAVLAPAKSQDPLSGAEVIAWGHAFFTQADFIPLSIKDFVSAAASQSQLKGRFVVNFRPDWPSDFRIEHQGVRYQSPGALPDNRSGRQELIIPVEEDILGEKT